MNNTKRALELKERLWGLGVRACLDEEKMGEVVKEEDEEINSDSIDGEQISVKKMKTKGRIICIK